MKSVIISVSLLLCCPEDEYKKIERYAEAQEITVEQLLENSFKDKFNFPFTAYPIVEYIEDFEHYVLATD